jgi:SSS family solute:Na+ symporter
MLGAAISTDEAYLHSWASIFVQDVVLPFRKRPMSPRAQLLLLKSAVLGVAIFAFFFSLHWQPGEYIAMYGALTGSIFVAGGGAAIIGGLYTRWGTAAGAWAAMLAGIGISVPGLVVLNAPTPWVEALSSTAPPVPQAIADAFLWVRAHVTGMELSFVAMMASCIGYVGASLAGGVRSFDLDRMLHRGRWRVEGDAAADEAPQTFMEKLGFDRQYKGWDRFVAYVTLAWPLAFTLLFVIGTPWLLWRQSQGDPVGDAQWSAWWQGWSWFILASSTVVVAWFTIGGIRDYLRLRRDLRSFRADASDDGSVR